MFISYDYCPEKRLNTGKIKISKNQQSIYISIKITFGMKEAVGWIYRDLYTINSIHPSEGISTAVTILCLLFFNVSCCSR